MKQTKRILAFLLAFVMLASTAAFSASAKASLPATTAAATYDQTSKIILSTDQYATLILDKLDEILAEAGIYLDLGELIPPGMLGPINISGTFDLRSIDKAFDSLAGFEGLLKSIYNLNIIPALSPGLNLTYVTAKTGDNKAPRRSDNGPQTDTQVLQAIFNILSDPNPTAPGTQPNRTTTNAKMLGGIVGQVLSGNLVGALGSVVGNLLPSLLGGTVDLTNIPGLIKGMLYGIIHAPAPDPDNPDAEPEPVVPPPDIASVSLDSLVQELLVKLLGDMEPIAITADDPETPEDETVALDLGAILGEIDIETDTVYGLIDKLLKPVYEALIAPMLDGMLRDLLADAAESSGFGEYINLEYDAPTWSELGIDATHTIFDQLNNLIGLFVERIIVYDGLNWVPGGNEKLVPNIIEVGRILIVEFGADIFPGVVFKTEAEIDAMSDMQFVAYFAKTIINQLMYYVYVPDKIGTQDIDTLTEVLNVVLIEQAGDSIPERYNALKTNYYDNPVNLDKMATTLEILSDYLVKFLFHVVDTNVLTDRSNSGKANATPAGTNSLKYADTFDQTIGKLFNWVVGNYGGAINPTKLDGSADLAARGWKTVTNILFSIIDSTWLGGDGTVVYGPSGRGVKELLLDDILGQLLGSSDTANPGVIKIDKALSLFSKNTTPNAELNKPVAQVLIKLVLDVLDLVLGGTAGVVSTGGMRADYVKLDSILTKTQHLGTLVENLLTRLGQSGSRLIPSALPLVADLMGMTAASAYSSPSFALERMLPHPRDAGMPPVEFTVENTSGGLPGVNYNIKQGKQAESAYEYVLQNARVTFVTQDSMTNMQDPMTNAGLYVSVNSVRLDPLHTVTVAPGKSVTMRLVVPEKTVVPVNSLITIGLTYSVGPVGADPFATLTSHIYTFLASGSLFIPGEGVNEGKLVLNDDANKQPHSEEGEYPSQVGQGSGVQFGADDGFANTAVNAPFIFVNQNTTVAQLAEKLQVTIQRELDTGKWVQGTDPGSGEPIMIRQEAPRNLAESQVGIGACYPAAALAYGVGSLSEAYKAWHFGFDEASGAPFPPSTTKTISNYFVVKDPLDPSNQEAKTTNGGSATLRPFEVLNGDATTVDVFDEVENAFYPKELLDAETQEPIPLANWPVTHLFQNANGETVDTRQQIDVIVTAAGTSGAVSELVDVGPDGVEGGTDDVYSIPMDTAGRLQEMYDDPYNVFMEDYDLYDMEAVPKAEGFLVAFTVVITNDYGLPKLVDDAIRLDAQSTRYSDPAAFQTYLNDISNAAWVALRPQDSGVKATGTGAFAAKFAEDMLALQGSTNNASSVGELEDLLQKIYGYRDNAYIDPNTEEKVYLDYWDEDYVYLAAGDFIPAGYAKAIEAIRMAESVVDRGNDPEFKNPPTNLEVKYAMYLLQTTCDSILEPLAYTVAPTDQVIESWQLLPTAAYDEAMQYQLAWLESAPLLGNSGVSFTQFKAAFNAAGGYDNAGHYPTSVLNAANEAIVLDGNSVRALMRAYDNILAINASYNAAGKALMLGQMNPFSPEFMADNSPIEQAKWNQLGQNGVKRIRQSQITRARDELVYAYKRVVVAAEETEPPVDPSGLNWKPLDDFMVKYTTQSPLGANELVGAGEDPMTFEEYFDFYYMENVFVPAYEAYFGNCLSEATDLLTYKGEEDEAELTTNEEIAETAVKLEDALQRLIAIIPNPAGFVYDKDGSKTKIDVDTMAYNAAAAAAYLDEELPNVADSWGEAQDGAIYDYATGSWYDGYITTLDITRPSLSNQINGKAPYIVLNGTGTVQTNAAGKYLTGASLKVVTADDTHFMTLKAVYYGDPNGNGVILEAAEKTDIAMLRAGQKYLTSGDGAVNTTPGAHSPATKAMDVASAFGEINADDQLKFATAGTRFVDQVFVIPQSNWSRVTKGKPTTPQP
ncbi:MAG: hypothetical protein LBC83_00910 [Oscillospiraceae bacterium]|nr:hypothetical protein [Oscillospiraceae bacterium]